ncbi:MAG: hypothetical protein A2X84_01200 [Desulfuromonadaceae bacterium GWC2_58_13]|nr:MAG: hypothetical protein A2X84_01200 [Desulfuromonadaceae bacterium GWC2_58_13]
MNAVIKEWITKADGDFRTAQREFDAIEAPNFDAVCFHAQQCIEKLMKALLIAGEESPPRVHDLAVLSNIINRNFPNWNWPVEELRFLSRAAVTFRYPGESAEQLDAEEALAIAKNLRDALLVQLQDK